MGYYPMELLMVYIPLLFHPQDPRLPQEKTRPLWVPQMEFLVVLQVMGLRPPVGTHVRYAVLHSTHIKPMVVT
jgi:hypothetical protein